MKNNIVCYLKTMTNLLEKNKAKILRKYSITTSQTDILIYLFKNEGKEIYQKDIQEQFKLTNPTVNGIIKRLENKNMVCRQKNPVNKRLSLIKLTRSGQQMKKQMELNSVKFNDQLLSNISKTDLEIFIKVLEQLLENTKNIDFKESEIK